MKAYNNNNSSNIEIEQFKVYKVDKFTFLGVVPTKTGKKKAYQFNKG